MARRELEPSVSTRLYALVFIAAGLGACRTAPKDADGTVLDTGSLSGEDADGDGRVGADDCDDLDASIHAGAEELCDGVDNDCDGEIDEGVMLTWFDDSDGDGFGDPTVSSEACEPGPGQVPNDDDCNDADAHIFPGAPEVCDGIDNNCDGLADEGDPVLTYADNDGDGFGDPATELEECGTTEGRVLDHTDCDDDDALIHPDGIEVCNEVDDDCDDDVDEGLDVTWYRDEDGDGWGLVDLTTQDCSEPEGYAALPGDCDDTDNTVHPDATEVCNRIDDDCDGVVDGSGAADASDWYADTDLDGYGDPATTARDCDAPSGMVADNTDCDDTNSAVHPAATEVCNRIDDDCDTLVDDDDTSLDTSTGSTWYTDADSDGYGDVASTTQACSQPSGMVADHSDCDDSAAAVNPGAAEVCNRIDDDCDGLTDDDDSSVDTSTGSTWYADSDGDGYGDATSTSLACDQPSGAVSDNTDCDDSAAAVNPAATEVCNRIDDDCDGLTDDDDTSVDLSTASAWYTDADADGYGDASASSLACSQPTGTSAVDTDCDDSAAAVNPAATEVCNSIDDDCDTLVDDDDGSLDTSTGSTFYNDDDSDGYGDATASVAACIQPSGTVTDTTDCDDSVATVYPGATELCNLVDDDCDGTVDDGVMGSGSACPADSCLDILVDQPSSATGTYTIDFDGTATDTTCDMSTDGGGWTLVFSDDFESTPHAGWSTSSTYACASWSTILGGYGNTAGTEIDITIDIFGVAHTEARVELEYIALDSWDGELAYVEADGTTLFSQNQNNHSSSYGEVCGWDRGYYGSYDSTWTVDETITHTDDELDLIAGSTLDQAPTDESFGIDDVMLWVR